MPIEDVLDRAGNFIVKARQSLLKYINYNEEESFSINSTSHSRWAKSAYEDLHAAISAGVAIGKLQKAMKEIEDKETNCSTNGVNLGLKVTIPESGNGNSERWIVPEVTREST
ncbi:hypothetical protein RRF57_010991 [Xylaria bambusicola]|uniref:Uncharacterized protein n=1 Tax=Xylaria bambusicola TaxID=326684 RepID=A0AAN7V267_9PEZI